MRGASGTLFTAEIASASLLVWPRGGINLTISGRINGDQAIKVAESLE